MDVTIHFNVNDSAREVTTDRQRRLLDVLREDLGLTGSRFGCGEGQCGACTVLIDGKTTRSCITPIGSVEGKSVTTIEGLAPTGTLHPVQQAFLDKGAMQCGYCTSGMIMSTVALLERNPDPSDAEIVTALNGNLCRCNGYARIIDAVRHAARIARS
ncbi:MAG: (2Fe-2S)-binding protein [Acidobacteriota bacterium]|jgi:aerobic-type carbon monoxide dehydrogenase small subunit (CoxS/CutS family)